MATPVYAWFYQDPFHSVFIAATTTLSVLSNSLLLFIIFTTNSAGIGPYRYLLAVFAVCDIMTSAGHAAFQPTMQMTSTGFFFFPHHGKMMIGGRSFDTTFALIFIATYYQTFLVLAYHFIYRYKTVSGGIVHSITDGLSAKHWILLAVSVYVLYIAGFVGTCAVAFTPTNETRALVPAEIKDTYGVDLRDPSRGFTVIAVRRPDSSGQMVWHTPSVVGLLALLGMFGGTASVIVYCIWQINRVIRSSGNHLTEKTRRMQIILFKALLIQTAIPMLFSYAPLATVLVFPAITGISLGSFGNILFSTTSIFPAIDSFFVLYFIVRFRVAVIRLLRLPIKDVPSSSVERLSDARTTRTVRAVTTERVASIASLQG